MIRTMVRNVRSLGAVLVDPRGTLRVVLERPSPLLLAGVLLAGAAVLGCGTLPRQLSLLSAALPVPSEPLLAAQQQQLREGIARLIVMDRLIPQPTLLLGAAAVVLLAEPVLMLARDRRAALVAVAVLGLAPLVVARLGELALSQLVILPSPVSPAEAIRLPHRFVTGPLAFWRAADPAPTWLELLNARVNLVSLWCVALWAIGLRELDGRRWALWHVALPTAALAAASVVTWAVGPWVLAMVLR